MVRLTDRPAMTIAVDLGRKATKPTNQNEDQQLVFKTDYRLMQVKSVREHSATLLTFILEHSATLLTLIKLPFVFKSFVLSIFEWPLKTGFTVGPNLRSLVLFNMPCSIGIYHSHLSSKVLCAGIYCLTISFMNIHAKLHPL